MKEAFNSLADLVAYDRPGGAGGRAELKRRAIALLARREHSRAELARKLLSGPGRGVRRAGKWRRDRPDAGLDAGSDCPDFADPDASAAEAAERQAQVEAVLDELESLHLLSDRRMAEALVRGGAARFGAARLGQNLQRKGVDAGLILDVLQPLADNERERAQAVWQRRFGRAPADLREKARQYRFLLGRGFSAAIVAAVVPSLCRADPGEDQDSDPEMDEIVPEAWPGDGNR